MSPLKKILISIVFLIMVAIAALAHQTNEEIHLYKSLESQLLNKDQVPVGDVTDFDWDQICYVGKHMILPIEISGKYSRSADIKRWLNIDPVILQGYIPNTYMPNYKGAFIFIKQNQAFKKLTYKFFGFGFYD